MYAVVLTSRGGQAVVVPTAVSCSSEDGYVSVATPCAERV